MIKLFENYNMKNGKVLGLRTAIYKVGNLQEAKEWYAKAFDTAPYFDEPFYVGFNIGGYELGLLPEEEPTTDKQASVLTYWGVGDSAMDETYERFLNLGAKSHEEPHSVGGPIVVGTVIDPWGNIIGLIYNPVFNLNE